MKMYTVIRVKENDWLGICVIQDGTERCEKSTRKAAVEWVIYCAKGMNHVDITEADIVFGEEEKIESISVSRDDARMQTIAVLTGIIDDLNFDNLKLRSALDTIANMPYACSDAKRVANKALDIK